MHKNMDALYIYNNADGNLILYYSEYDIENNIKKYI